MGLYVAVDRRLRRHFSPLSRYFAAVDDKRPDLSAVEAVFAGDGRLSAPTVQQWLLLGGVTRLIDYWAADVDPPSYITALERAAFRTLVRNDRGFRRIA